MTSYNNENGQRFVICTPLIFIIVKYKKAKYIFYITRKLKILDKSIDFRQLL